MDYIILLSANRTKLFEPHGNKIYVLLLLNPFNPFEKNYYYRYQPHGHELFELLASIQIIRNVRIKITYRTELLSHPN